METEPDDVMAAVGRAIELGGAGDRAGARTVLEQAWAEVGAGGDPLHRCAIAHTMADLTDDVRDELAWDMRAMEAAGGVTDERVAAAGMATSARGLYPSLHLNLADAYRRLDDPARAREHVALGTDALGALGDDGYGRMIAGGLRRLADELGPG